MTSWIEGKVNEFCGRWLEGFTKDNVDVSLLQAKITLSDLHFKTVSIRCFVVSKKQQDGRGGTAGCRWEITVKEKLALHIPNAAIVCVKSRLCSCVEN